MTRTFLAAAIAAAFAFPLAAQADDAKPLNSTGPGITGPSDAKEDVHNPQVTGEGSRAAPSSSGGTSSTGIQKGGANDGGAAGMFQRLDKNNDGFLSSDE